MDYFDDAQFLFNERHQEMQTFLTKFKLIKEQGGMMNRMDEHILKSNIILMQYNTLESSFLELYKSFYLFLKNCQVSLDNINKDFAYNIYLMIKRGSSKKTEKLKDKLFNSTNVSFSNSAMFTSFDLDEEEKKFLINGNLDGRKIKSFLTDFGIDIKLIEPIELNGLQLLKEKRQLLAHGGASFSDVGRDISWDALESNVDTLKQLFDATKLTLTGFCSTLNRQSSL